MEIERRALLGVGLGLGLVAASASAQRWGDPPTPAAGDPEAPAWPPKERLQLWPGGAPGAPTRLPVADWTMNGPRGSRQLWIRGVPVPEVNVFRPAKPDGSALLVIPGGGYGFLSVENEGIDVAQNLNARGTTVFVLTYRLPGEGWASRHLVPLQDAQRAMRLIRSRAGDFGIEPARLGVLGFSAGGHLAADLAVAHDERIYQSVDAADSQPARPAFAGLIYPVATLEPRIAHGGSRDNLLGPNPSPARINERSPLLHVDSRTPPCFLVHTSDDTTVPIENSLEWMARCRAAKVPVDALLASGGGHGFGLRLAEDMPASRWPDLFALWMRKHGG